MQRAVVRFTHPTHSRPRIVRKSRRSKTRNGFAAAYRSLGIPHTPQGRGASCGGAPRDEIIGEFIGFLAARQRGVGVSEPFNPYEEWLETPGGVRPEHHYAMLGLKPFESDPQVIAQAADGLRSRVRRIRPGPHMAEWQMLLDEIATAKNCLLDAQAKAAYDAQLRHPPKRPTPPTAQPGFQTPPPPTAQPGFQAPPPPPWLQAPSTPAAQPGFQPPPPPAWLQQPQTPQPSQAWAPQPPAQPFAPPQVPAFVPPELFMPEEPVAGMRSKRERKSFVERVAGPLIVVVFVGTALGGYIAFRVLREQGYTIAANATVSETSPPAPVAENKTQAKPAAGEKSTAAAVQESGSKSASSVKPAPATTSAEPPKPAAQIVQPSTPALPAADQMSAPAPAMSDQAMAAPAAKSAPSDPAKQAELHSGIKAARAAMRQRNLTEAQKGLAQARANVQSPEDDLLVTRYENLANYLTQFWKGIARRLSAFKPMDEVELAKTRIIVVESNAEEIRFKSGGKVFHYRIDTMPVPFVAGLVEGALNDAQSKVIFGAFLAVDPRGDATRALELWTEAAEAGQKVDQLLPSVAELAASREGAPSAASAAPAGAAPAAAADPERFRKELAEMLGKGQTATEAAGLRELSKQAATVAHEAIAAKCLDEALQIVRFSGEMARKAKSPTLAKQATALERKVEAALKRQSGK